MNAYLDIYTKLASQELQGRYLNATAIAPFLGRFSAVDIGTSVAGIPIKAITLGNGPIKILMWSQMHGNETTSTKGLFDVLNYLKDNPENYSSFTLKVIPMLNPDGADLFTRVNYNKVDLNREAIAQTQPEASLLIETYNTFKPDYCFNLHGQRTIFGVNGKPCMLSFLAPAADAEKSVPKARETAMGIIGSINHKLQGFIPDQVGRYDDTFNINCMGDYFMSQGTPTILFECGQVGEDYGREQTRKWFGLSLLAALKSISTNSFRPAEYHNIPEVEKSFVDILLTNVNHENNNVNVAIQFKEVLREGSIHFIPYIHSIGSLPAILGHRTIDLKHQNITLPNNVLVNQDASEWVNLLNLTQYSH